ncbi:hypothetical protein [Pseudomonas auratipiscis]|uniref:Uncharacterized protein n=1 Tax=Pseudomonas auratipiscis TaxID=3115853 RepID=A0AB35X0G0_9PSED|nr:MULTISPECIES: hypothetical protein [unclassified Pseudomonas]MEE1869037.1 hypothetical protein [Pseudomonas sp. 120P]MEE1959684.1 hypothetical protein [Pseudomonas sp. 119P]
MSPHQIAVKAIEAAIETMLLPGATAIEDAKAETTIVNFFSILVINAEEFKHYCERVRRISERRKEAA